MFCVILFGCVMSGAVIQLTAAQLAPLSSVRSAQAPGLFAILGLGSATVLTPTLSSCVCPRCEHWQRSPPCMRSRAIIQMCAALSAAFRENCIAVWRRKRKLTKRPRHPSRQAVVAVRAGGGCYFKLLFVSHRRRPPHQSVDLLLVAVRQRRTQMGTCPPKTAGQDPWLAASVGAEIVANRAHSFRPPHHMSRTHMRQWCRVYQTSRQP